MYTEKYSLQNHIHFNTEVINIQKTISPSNNSNQGDNWIVITRDNLTSIVSSEIFNGIMVCSGHHSEPIIPKFDGLDSFNGISVHSKDIDTIMDKVSGKDVLVIGAGNSAGDAAVDCSNHGARSVTLLMRSGTWLISRMGPKGNPIDQFVFTRFKRTLVQLLPRRIEKFILEWFVETCLTFDHDYYGLKPDHRMMDQQALINDHLGSKIISGLINVIRGNVKKVTSENVVTFEVSDGKGKKEKELNGKKPRVIEKRFDVIVFATGYKITHPFLDWDTEIKEQSNRVNGGKVDERKNERELKQMNGESNILIVNENVEEEWRKLYLKVFSPKFPPSLCFIGLIQPLGAFIPAVELQVRLYSAVMSGNLP